MTAAADNTLPTNIRALYQDLHRNPELSFAETRTAGIAADHLRAAGFDVLSGVGRTGVVGVLRNGHGPTVLLRADMDALPVKEETGLDYASTATGIGPDGAEVPVMHACGHDVHVTCLIGAAEHLAATRSQWNGTLIALFQPAEEVGAGARAMIADGLYDRVPRPDVVLGQHVGPAPAGCVGVRPGAAFASEDSIDITVFGRGGHGSRPETTIDPVVIAAAIVLRLQSVVAREIAPQETAVVTVGQIHAGNKNNIIAATATLGLSVRAYSQTVRTRILSAIDRIVRAEAVASGAEREPLIEFAESIPVTVNEPAATERTNSAFRAAFGSDAVYDPGQVSGSEDVGELATAAGAPLVYWILGGTDAREFAAAVAAGTAEQEIASNHSPHFAPVIDPTLDRGIEALIVAAREWLGS
ncbi:amidohydrolase [Rhodococcus sp. IEGM 1379]|uniref:amidohydrolase n=1 Tax=Rhodococcus sp. IEGM 1379 TaxID=3047086 RepID=UPI0024B77EB1|nr:amidohydrolase [Rhodococcus sp. IEGM 1379]MDI9915294.1 amidohydrolase [Rhodococcus sp. IEGM 1379]